MNSRKILSSSIRTTIFGTAFCLLGANLLAQGAAPLIRRPSSVTVTKTDDNRSEEPGPNGVRPTPQPTPDPKSVIVAIVNSHSITRAQLDQRVAARTRHNPEKMREQYATTNQIIDSFGDDLETKEMEVYQQRQIERAIQEEESAVILEWQEQMMLADEARRHGFLITNQELQAKLAFLDEEFNIGDTRVDNLLEAMGMTRAELESHVYDALLIEKLLNRFLELNYSESDYFNIWQTNRAAYRIPPKLKIAHFTEGLLGNEKPQYLRGVKERLQDVRDRLRDDENPYKLTQEFSELEFGVAGSVVDWSTESLGQNRNRREFFMPDSVVEELLDSEEGDISKVLTDEYTDSSGKRYILSFHLFKVLEEIPAQGETFEEAMPMIKDQMIEYSRDTVVRMLRDAKTHKRITKMSGIRPDKIPTKAELGGYKPPVSLKLDS